MSKALLGIVIFALAAGCAGVRHSPIRSDKADQWAHGFRYYETSPYLLVYSDGKGGVSWSIQYMPDQTKKMSAWPYNFLAVMGPLGDKPSLAFSNGMLTGASAEGKADAVPKALVEAAQSAIPLLAAAARVAVTDSTPTNEPTVPAPHLYKIVVQGADVAFYGGKADVPVHVTLAE